MKRLLHLSVVSAVVLLMGLGYWTSARASTDAGATTSTETEVTGVVEAFDATSVTVDGVVYTITDTTEVDGTLAIGSTVKLEVITGADGSLTVTELETEDDVEDIDEDSSTGTEDELDDQDEDTEEVETDDSEEQSGDLSSSAGQSDDSGSGSDSVESD
ncbi:MAG TPA: DUF5666 domain-containing protein [Anaerolineales bacterium]